MDDIKQHFFSRTLWLRIIYMIVFYVVSKVLWMLIMLIAIVQALSNLITGKVIEAVWEFSGGLNAYMLQIFDFLAFRSEEKPFPFSDWPCEKKSEFSTSDEKSE